MPEVLIGTAGWTVPKVHRDGLPDVGTHLQRYAAILRAAEINSSFYRSHRRDVYMKWADSVPAEFRFAVKMPKSITHERRLRRVKALVSAFSKEASGLKTKLGCVLVQLPPSFEFYAAAADSFFEHLNGRMPVDIACEPRHATWFGAEADALLARRGVARVVADPPVTPAGKTPGGSAVLTYYRLHGSPRMYYSRYSEAYLKRLARNISNASPRRRIWCFFDNTAAGEGFGDALRLSQMLAQPPSKRREPQKL